MYYDKNGAPLDIMEWSGLFNNPEYKRIAFDSDDKYDVSTVWLGLDHGFGGEMRIFETMVFASGSLTDLACERYATLTEAEAGHKVFVKNWLGKKNRFRDL